MESAGTTEPLEWNSRFASIVCPAPGASHGETGVRCATASSSEVASRRERFQRDGERLRRDVSGAGHHRRRPWCQFDWYLDHPIIGVVIETADNWGFAAAYLYLPGVEIRSDILNVDDRTNTWGKPGFTGRLVPD